MLKLRPSRLTAINTRIVFWPCMVDLLISVLMIFLLIHFIQATLGQDDVEAQIIRQKQNTFAEVFDQEFAREKDKGEVSIQKTLNLIRITFSDHVLFPTRQYQLQTRGQEVLRRCAAIFNKSAQLGFKQILVEGHTDNREFRSQVYPHDNWELSTGRAISVVKFLIENGLKENLLSANGYAATKPIDVHDTEAARALNRRIEIRIIFSTPE